MTQGYSNLGQKYAEAVLSIPNTLEIRPGYRFTIMVNRDMHLPQKGGCGGNSPNQAGIAGRMRP